MATPSDNNTATIRGKGYFVMVLGEPRDKLDNKGRAWSLNLTTDKESRALLKSKKIKNHFKVHDDWGQYCRFSKDEMNGKPGAQTPGKPVIVVDKDNNPWDHSILIGNESELEVTLGFSPRTFQGEAFNKCTLIKVKVLNHVPYEKTGEATKAKTAATTDDDDIWEDSIPF